MGRKDPDLFCRPPRRQAGIWGNGRREAEKRHLDKYEPQQYELRQVEQRSPEERWPAD